ISKENYELSLPDEDSDVVLESADDLFAAIDYAMHTRKTPSDTPCVRLTLVKSAPDAKEALEDDDEEEEKEEKLKEDQEEDDDESGCWIMKKAKAIRRWELNLHKYEPYERVYRCPVEYLKSQLGATPSEFEVVESEAPFDRQRKRKCEPAELAAMEKDLNIREKARKMKEETFERVVATLQVKMEEMEEKVMGLEKRVEEIEGKANDEQVKAKMNEMEERLKKVEEKMDEDE
ncbi:hypothetical protein PMAYCL1PPCAC_24582, partial [Pristionchus mayeri]